ncbi:MAG: alkaline phosphatase family protein [Myxococcota bacterium]
MRPRSGARVRTIPLALVPALVLALATGCRDTALESQADAVCAAVDAERFDEALARSETGSGAVGAGRRIAECRCIASLSLGDRAGCTALLDPLLRAPGAGDWVPHPVLTKLMLRTWQAAGALEPAAALATRAALRHRDDLDLLQLELMLRSTQQDEGALLSELEARAGDGLDALPQRLVLAVAYGRRGQHAEAIRALGERAPALDQPLATAWYESRIQAQAATGDLDAVQRTFATWQAAGADPIDLAARYALRLSTDQLDDPQHPKLDLLRAAIATQDRLTDRNIVWGLHRRLIAELLAAGRPEEALAAYDAAVDVVDLSGVSREELVRAVRRTDDPPAPDARATIVFALPEALRGGQLALSPDADAAPDSAYRRLSIADRRELVVASRRGPHPRRWVVRDAEGRVRASGSFWPEPGETRTITPSLRPSAPASPRAADVLATRGATTPARRPGDGRRRVIAILPDCGDWRLVQYLRARGELPFHDHLLEQGRRAVLESRPAFTAAALQSLVWPARPRARATLDWVHDLGLELAGLETVGSNPFAFLGFVLPERPNLFETLGARSLVTANMLLAHGRIDAGRHAEIVGPDGHHRTLETQAAYRPLSPRELERFPALAHDRDARRFAETIAAELDAALRIIGAGEIDFLFLRLEALDLVTHAHFGALDGAGQDDGAGPLLDTYRYIDARLAELDRALDRDDWLVYLSDHGIRSSMQHEEDAIFAVLGDGVPAGRVPGQPALRGVPRTLAAMFGIETDWPETGAAPWLERRRESARFAEVPR